MTKVMDRADLTGIVQPSQRLGFAVPQVGGGGSWAASLQPPESVVEAPRVRVHEYDLATRHLPFSLEHTETGVAITDIATGIFGFGETPFEAVQDLARALVDHREVLERQKELTPDLQDQLKYLRQFP